MLILRVISTALLSCCCRSCCSSTQSLIVVVVVVHGLEVYVPVVDSSVGKFVCDDVFASLSFEVIVVVAAELT